MVSVADSIGGNFGVPSPGAVNDKLIAFFSKMYTTSGSPEGSVTAPTGSFCYDLTNAIMYAKKSGSGNTGWVSDTSQTTTLAANPVVYVAADGSGSDSNDGRSPGTAFATLAAAVTALGGFGTVQLLPGRHTITDTITKRQGISILGSGRQIYTNGGSEIYYNGPDDGRYAITTAFSDASDDTYGLMQNFRLTCAAGMTLARGIHWRNAQNLSSIRKVYINGFPTYGMYIDDTQAAATNTMPGYVVCEEVWVSGGTVPWYMRMGFTSVMFNMCACDSDAATTDIFVIDPPQGASSARGGMDGNLIFLGFKAECADTAGGAGDCHFFTFNTDAAAALIDCSFRKSAGNSTGKFINYTVAPASSNSRSGVIPIEIINCTTSNTLHLISATATTPVIAFDAPTASGGEVYQFSWSGWRDVAAFLPTPFTASPTAPSAGLLVYPRSIASRSSLAVLGATGVERVLGTAPWMRFWHLLTPQSGTSLRSSGFGSAFSATGTVSHPGGNKAYGYPANIVSSGLANGQACVTGGNPSFFRGAAGDPFGGFFMHSRCRFPDASYDNTGAATGSRIWALAGYNSSSTTLLQTARGGAQVLIGFNRENVNGSNTDTNWQFVTNDNVTGPTVTDTTIPFTVTNLYDFFIWGPEGGTAIYWEIRDVTAGTVARGTASTTLPTSVQSLIPISGLLSVDAVARNYQFTRLFVEADQG